MPPPPIPVVTVPDKDAEHLRLLVIFHFVHAGFQALSLVFGVFHFFVMKNVFVNGGFFKNVKGPAPDFEMMLRFMVPFYIVMALFGLGLMIYSILCGLWLRQRKHRTMCLVCAGIECLALPLGTILGIFTILVLNRDSVRMLFAPRTAPNA